MNFSGLFTKKQKPVESYFGLFLRSNSAVGFVFEVKEGEVSVVAKEICTYSNGWESIVDDIDQLLAVLENETEIHVDKTIFFVYSFFIDQNTQEIKAPYKGIIKQLSKELDLLPMGFIECHEAVKDMFEKRETTPLNAVLIELDDVHVGVYVFKGGKTIHSAQSARTDSIGSDLQELFMQNRDKYLLPSKVIVYGTQGIDQDAKVIKDYPWDEDIFIQSPRVQVFKGEELFTGLSNSFIAQISPEVQKSVAQIDDEVPEPAAEALQKSPAAHSIGDSVMEQEPEHDDIPDEAEQMGFVIGEDITALQEPPAVSKTKRGSSFPKLRLPAFSLKMPQLSFRGGGARFAIIGGIMLFLVAAGAATEYFFHSASLVIELPSETISDDLTLSAPVTNELDNGFTVQRQSQSSQVEKKLATSGEREVGEKAKGTVIIHNFEDAAARFSAGTIVTINDKQFTLDSDVSVASASERPDEIVKEPGKQTVSVTASEIGESYNIGSGERLTVADRSRSKVFALTDGAFTGGSKKTLKTIAKRDIDLLDEALEDQLKKQNDQVKGVSDNGLVMLETITENDVEDKSYSGEVGQEADEVSVNAKATVRTYLFSESSLQKQVAEQIKKEAPAGFTIDPDSIEYKVRSTEKKGETVRLEVSAEAVLRKEVDKDELKKRVAGKGIEAATDIIKREFEAERVVVEENFSPILLLNGLLPFSAENIELRLDSV